MSGRGFRIGLSVAVSAVFLAFAVRGVNWGEAIEALQRANYLYVIPMLPVTVWTLLIRAQRWRVFLRAVGVPPMRTLVAATNIGFMANMVLPLRIGEVVRPVLVSRREGLPLSGMLASVLLERIFDMFTILFLFGVSASLVTVSEQVRRWGVMLSVLAFAVGATVALVRWKEAQALGVAQRMCNLLPARLGEPAYHFVRGFVQALEMLDSPQAFLRAFGWSLYLWLAIALVYVFGFVAFGLPVSTSTLTAALVTTTIVAVAVSVPQAPGYIGAFQLGCVLGLAIFDIPRSEAMAYSIVVHLTQFVGCIAAGLYSLWTEGISLREVESVERSDGVDA